MAPLLIAAEKIQIRRVPLLRYNVYIIIINFICTTLSSERTNNTLENSGCLCVIVSNKYTNVDLERKFGTYSISLSHNMVFYFTR